MTSGGLLIAGRLAGRLVPVPRDCQMRELPRAVMPRFIDLIGKKFGRLLVVGAVARDRGHPRHWRCRCDCGADASVAGRELRAGDTKSCGCYKRDLVRVLHKTHGHSSNGKRSPTYYSWRAMRSRCFDPNSVYYASYGGRGITVCERWRDSFEAFLDDMGERPAGKTLDRRDVNGLYSPENCRWATAKEQGQNTSRVQITAALALEIAGRVEHGERQVSVARRIGVTKTIVNALIKGRTWRNVVGEIRV